MLLFSQDSVPRFFCITSAALTHADEHGGDSHNWSSWDYFPWVSALQSKGCTMKSCFRVSIEVPSLVCPGNPSNILTFEVIWLNKAFTCCSEKASAVYVRACSCRSAKSFGLEKAPGANLLQPCKTIWPSLFLFLVWPRQCERKKIVCSWLTRA